MIRKWKILFTKKKKKTQKNLRVCQSCSSSFSCLHIVVNIKILRNNLQMIRKLNILIYIYLLIYHQIPNIIPPNR